jgi:hypothetical protein
MQQHGRNETTTFSPSKTTPHLPYYFTQHSFLMRKKENTFSLQIFFAKIALRHLSAHFCRLFAISTSLERLSLNCAFVGLHGATFWTCLLHISEPGWRTFRQLACRSTGNMSGLARLKIPGLNQQL